MTAILKVRDKTTGEFISIPAIKGDTPQRGIDYYTTQDKAELRRDIIDDIVNELDGISGIQEETLNILG